LFRDAMRMLGISKVETLHKLGQEPVGSRGAKGLIYFHSVRARRATVSQHERVPS
jgi:hypothetical protein